MDQKIKIKPKVLFVGFDKHCVPYALTLSNTGISNSGYKREL